MVRGKSIEKLGFCDMFKIAILGRPNVGKSTLFNQLTRRRDAIVHDRPGVTRDIIIGQIDWGGVEAEILDTAGIDLKMSGDAVEKAMADQSLYALKLADAVLFIVDGRHGVHPDDVALARMIQKSGKPVLLVMNKAESKKGTEFQYDFYRLGLGDPKPLSAEHRTGLEHIFDWLKTMTCKKNEDGIDCEEGADKPQPSRPVRLSIVGQPNVGKSTLINSIVGENRVLVHDMPGITRDTVLVPFVWAGRKLVLTDTAGVRKKAKVTDDVETISSIKALKAIEQSDVIVLVLDATLGLEKQDLTLAARVAEEGRILIVALNKWDLISSEEQEDLLFKLKNEFSNSFHQIIKPTILPISAMKGTGVKSLMKRVFTLWDLTDKHHATSAINRAVEKLMAATPPPLSKMKKPMKVKFAAQTEQRPTTVTLNVSGATEFPESYERYLRNGLAKKFGWENLVVRIRYKKSENPYENN